MSRIFLTSINLNQNELQNTRIQNLAAAPASPVTGQIYYSTAAACSYIWNGTAWIPTDATKATGIPIAALAIDPTQRANHSGTQLSSTISDLASVVKGYTFNSFALTTGNIPMGGFTFTGLNTAPNAAGQAAEYSWVVAQIQSAAAGISSKYPVAAVATTNNALSGLGVVDGYTPVAGDRILVAGQSTASANGAYNAATGAWTRTTVEGAAPGEIEGGALWLVNNGTTYAGTQWRCSNTGAITVGTTNITIVQFSAAALYTAGNGLVQTGQSFAVLPAPSGGLLVSSAGVAVDNTIYVRKFGATIGDGTTTSFVLTHNLNTQDVDFQVRQTSSPFATVEVDMAATSLNTATVTFAQAPATNSYRVLIQG